MIIGKKQLPYVHCPKCIDTCDDDLIIKYLSKQSAVYWSLSELWSDNGILLNIDKCSSQKRPQMFPR